MQNAITDFPSGVRKEKEEGKNDGSVAGVGTGKDELGIECEGRLEQRACASEGERERLDRQVGQLQ